MKNRYLPCVFCFSVSVARYSCTIRKGYSSTAARRDMVYKDKNSEQWVNIGVLHYLSVCMYPISLHLSTSPHFVQTRKNLKKQDSFVLQCNSELFTFLNLATFRLLLIFDIKGYLLKKPTRLVIVPHLKTTETAYDLVATFLKYT